MIVLTFIQIYSQKGVLEDELNNRAGLMRRNLTERGKTLSDNLALQVENALASFILLEIISQTDKAVKENEELKYIILMNSAGRAHTRRQLEYLLLEIRDRGGVQSLHNRPKKPFAQKD